MSCGDIVISVLACEDSGSISSSRRILFPTNTILGLSWFHEMGTRQLLKFTAIKFVSFSSSYEMRESEKIVTIMKTTIMRTTSMKIKGVRDQQGEQMLDGLTESHERLTKTIIITLPLRVWEHTHIMSVSPSSQLPVKHSQTNFYHSD